MASRCLVLLALLSTFTIVSSSSSARPIWMPAWLHHEATEKKINAREKQAEKGGEFECVVRMPVEGVDGNGSDKKNGNERLRHNCVCACVFFFLDACAGCETGNITCFGS